jgi:hypothetical protein
MLSPVFFMFAALTTNKPRRKSIRKEAIKTILEGQESRITVTIKPDGSPRIETETFKENPDKISFGKLSDGQNRLECCSYTDLIGLYSFIFVNGERICIDKYQWRKLQGTVMKMGYNLGVFKKKRHRK